MLSASLHILFAFAWAVLAFQVVRSLLSLWRADRRIATAAAIAVAGAFFLGSTGPAAWSPLPTASSNPSAPAPAAATIPTVACPAGLLVGPHPAKGYIDAYQIGNAPELKNAQSVTLSVGSPLRLIGWAALDSGPGIAACFIVDRHTVRSDGAYGSARPDVAQAMNLAADNASGYSMAASLEPGTHQIGVGVLESDRHTVDAIPGVLHVTIR
jgi:hypothetical protein